MKNKHDTVAGMLSKKWYRYCVDIIEVSEGTSESAKKEMVQPLRCLGDQKTTSKYWRDYWRNAIDDDWWSEQQLKLSQSSHAGAGTELGKNAEVQDGEDVVHAKTNDYDEISNNGKRGNVEIKANEESIEILEKNKIEEQRDDMIDTVQVSPDFVTCLEDAFDDTVIEVNEIEEKSRSAPDLASIGLVPLNIVDGSVSCKTYFVYVAPALQCQLWDPGGHIEYCA